ncbi:MAG: tripartite tricarboxylate transporter substrate binding protein [Alcaligenaceae bacterium]|nr:tripartite tricarboxylate transporter substrate binding protein [Alcaligenaceae bacterium]
MRIGKFFLSVMACMSLAGVMATSASGSLSYPNRTVNVIVGFGAGGASDILARVLASELQREWGQSVVVDNKAGASGIIGTGFVAKSKPDGYTLQLLAGNHTINPALRNNLPFDSVKDVTPLMLVASAPNMLIVRADSGFQSLEDYIAAAKSRPEAVSYATSGIGTTVHLAGEKFANMADIKLNHIPYKGSAQSVNAVLSGEVDSAWVALNSSLSFVKSGDVRVLGIASKDRSDFLPDVPVLKEQGIDMESHNWLAVSGPGNMADDIVMKIQSDLKRVLEKPAFLQRLAELGLAPIGMEHGEFARLIQDEIKDYRQTVESAGIKPE